MKCPNCGHEIPDGQFYCEKCGHEVMIVSDFEPNIENSITQTLTDVAVTVAPLPEREGDESAAADGGALEKRADTGADEGNASAADRKERTILSLPVLILPAVLIVVLFVTILLCVKQYRGTSVNYQLKLAREQAESGRYADAIVYVDRAYALAPENYEVLLLRANYYLADGNEAAALRALTDIIEGVERDGAQETNEGTLLSAYTGLAGIYASHSDFGTLAELLNECENEKVREKFKEYLSLPPQFNYVDGSYDMAVPLKIFDDGVGEIYYTTDGSKPTEESLLYTSPIFLQDGEHHIRAVFVNVHGVVSKEAEKRFHIELPVPAAPEIDAYSGDYDKATFITVKAEEDCRVFYTTNGKEPDESSTEYIGPIPMPLGDTTMKFVAINAGGTASEITERSYHLRLHTSLRVANAIENVYAYQLAQGKIIDYEGNTVDNSGSFSYRLFYCIPVEDYGDFYLIYEYFSNIPDKGEGRTGNIYAVSLDDGSVYPASYDRSGTYFIEGLEPKEEKEGANVSD